MPFCSGCGTQHNDGARFCATCGVALRRPSRIPLWAYVVGAFVVALVLGSVLGLTLRHFHKESTTSARSAAPHRPPREQHRSSARVQSSAAPTTAIHYDPFVRANELASRIVAVPAGTSSSLRGYGFELLKSDAAYARAYHALLNGPDGGKLLALPGFLLDQATETPSAVYETPHGRLVVSGVCWPHDCPKHGWYVYELDSGPMSAWLYHDGTATFAGDWQNPDIPGVIILLHACEDSDCGQDSNGNPTFPLTPAQRAGVAASIEQLRTTP